MQNYIRAIASKYTMQNTAKGREMLYRSEMEQLLKTVFVTDSKVTNINHDSTNDSGNKPDFVVQNNNIPILYLEAKDIGINLDKIEKSEQMGRYFGYDNLVLTDYLEFRFYRNGLKYCEPICIGKIDKEKQIIVAIPDNFLLLNQTLKDFASTHKEPIKSGNHLARLMGGKARRVRDNVLDMLNYPEIRENKELLNMRDVVKETLVSGIDDQAFADMYAQTLVYGLFAARYNDKSPETFSRSEARELVPRSNPFLRSFFDHIAGVSFPQRLGIIVDELCEVFTHANIENILHDFYSKEKDSKDPIIHFYEDFLKEYDMQKKMEMGVFYTPRPVVQFIVRAVDSILKKDFGVQKGLADSTKVQVVKKVVDAFGKEKISKPEYHKVQVLDLATGTGTFLNEVIQHVYKSFTGQEGRWQGYVKDNLLPRLHGFELMMASYTIAHLKLGMTLHDTGGFHPDERLGVYLTNTLDEPVDYTHEGTLFGFMDSIAQESQLASRVKSEYPIMCVIGNPPYSGISMNRQYTDNNVYKVEPGGKEKLDERKNWLDDDYVKFIRFAESLIEKNGEGIVGMITAHGYVDNPTFRGMRWHLRQTFDSIYIVDLHGNSNKKETALDGSKDENVFDIKTGVSIILGVKKQITKESKKLAQVYKLNLQGLRKNKFEFLDSTQFENIEWVKLPEDNDIWRLEGDGKAEYQKGFSVADLFAKNTTGIVTMGDGFIIDQNKDNLTKRIDEFLYNDISEQDLTNKYSLGKNYAKWVVDNKKKIQNDHTKIVPLAYRPFDIRYTYFDNNLVWRTRTDTMKHFVNQENLGLVANRQVKAGDSWSHLFISYNIIESSLISNKTGEICSCFPLYLYTDFGEKIPNLDKEIWSKIDEIVGKSEPEDILDYIYAFLHSPVYREKYSEFLKTDFPRVPLSDSKEVFWKLVPLGKKLRNLHLMTDPECENLITTFPVDGSYEVEKTKFEGNKVFINDDQYFGGVPEVAWNFYIGGYQPAQKYLKDRKGKKLADEENDQYQKIIKVLVETSKLMTQVDEVLND